MELAEEGEHAVLHSSRRGFRWTAAVPAELSGHPGLAEACAPPAGVRAADAAVGRLARSDEALRADESLASALAAAGQAPHEQLACSIQCLGPSDDELLALHFRLGLATGAAERGSAPWPPPSHSTLPPSEKMVECGSRAGQCPPGLVPGLPGSAVGVHTPATGAGSAAPETPCPRGTSGAEAHRRLRDGFEELLAAEVSQAGQAAEAAGRATRTPLPAGFTTILIGNIPVCYRQSQLQKELERVGFLPGTIDFIYLPTGPGGYFNAGYAFVNFVSCAWLKRTVDVLAGYRFKKYQSTRRTKVASVSIARIQGLDANLALCNKRKTKMTRAKRVGGAAEFTVLARGAAGH